MFGYAKPVPVPALSGVVAGAVKAAHAEKGFPRSPVVKEVFALQATQSEVLKEEEVDVPDVSQIQNVGRLPATTSKALESKETITSSKSPVPSTESKEKRAPRFGNKEGTATSPVSPAGESKSKGIPK
jgi:hypothetical protein